MTWSDSDGVRALQFGLVTLVAALSVDGCAGGNSDVSPTINAQSAGSNPPPPPSNGNASLSWTAVTSDTAGNSLSGLAGYEIHYGPSEGALSYLIVVNDPQQTTYTIPGLAPGNWYFSVNAYTASGIEGLRSNIASKTVN